MCDRFGYLVSLLLFLTPAIISHSALRHITIFFLLEHHISKSDGTKTLARDESLFWLSQNLNFTVISIFFLLFLVSSRLNSRSHWLSIFLFLHLIYIQFYKFTRKENFLFIYDHFFSNPWMMRERDCAAKATSAFSFLLSSDFFVCSRSCWNRSFDINSCIRGHRMSDVKRSLASFSMTAFLHVLAGSFFSYHSPVSLFLFLIRWILMSRMLPYSGIWSLLNKTECIVHHNTWIVIFEFRAFQCRREEKRSEEKRSEWKLEDFSF